MVNAVTIYSADPANSIVSDSLKCTNGSVSADSQVRAALTDAGIPATLPAMKSKAYQNWTITFSETGMAFSASDDGPALQKAMGY